MGKAFGWLLLAAWGMAGAACAQAAPPTGADTVAVNQRIDQLLGDHAKYEPVIHAFQKAVATKDVAAVAALVAYPLKVTLAGKPATVRDAGDFVAHYDAIVSPAMAGTISGQAYGTLFVNQQGVMFGTGQAWINGICKDTACKQVEVKVVALQP